MYSFQLQQTIVCSEGHVEKCINCNSFSFHSTCTNDRSNYATSSYAFDFVLSTSSTGFSTNKLFQITRNAKDAKSSPHQYEHAKENIQVEHARYLQLYEKEKT